mmetsp:Transcript_64440/g.143317  ORF Transcript_64440/g.143317 Transcript_64440/m.143317 type:complete len:125 (-) Transcript_64440:496-870(-)
MTALEANFFSSWVTSPISAKKAFACVGFRPTVAVNQLVEHAGDIRCAAAAGDATGAESVPSREKFTALVGLLSWGDRLGESWGEVTRPSIEEAMDDTAPVWASELCEGTPDRFMTVSPSLPFGK